MQQHDILLTPNVLQPNIERGITLNTLKKPNIKLAVASVLCVYTIWGIQPLYWQYFADIPLPHILAHRIVWSAVFLLPIVLLNKQLPNLESAFKSAKQLKLSLLCSIAIGANWLVNIYAASTKQVVEASLGHYVTPIIIILLGVYILKEPIDLYKIIAILFATAGVVLITIYIGQLPMIALLLIVSFTLYTFLKKISVMDSLVGITLETLLLAPIALAYLIIKMNTGLPFFGTESTKSVLLLMSTGIFTSIPLLLFSYGVRGMNLSSFGFIQYYAPTVSLIIGIFIFNEHFSTMHLTSFGFIWIGILIVLIGPIIKGNKSSEDHKYIKGA